MTFLQDYKLLDIMLQYKPASGFKVQKHHFITGIQNPNAYGVCEAILRINPLNLHDFPQQVIDTMVQCNLDKNIALLVDSPSSCFPIRMHILYKV